MRALLILLVFGISGTALAQSTAAGRQKHFNIYKNHLAIQGYDPVAYFTDGKAVKGSGTYKHTENGVIYYFSPEEHREKFKKDPAKYEPQYGGWCAYAMGESGDKVEINPSTFKIVNGKLYLFYNKGGTNTKIDWNEDENNLLKQGNANWKKITGQ